MDDESTLQETLRWTFEHNGWRVVVSGTGEEAIRCLKTDRFDIVVTDIRLPGIDGIEVLRCARSLVARPPVVLITAYGTVETAVAALRHGAADYILKPFDLDDLKARVERLVDDTTATRRRWADPLGEIVGQTPGIQALRQQVQKAAMTSSNVLITGETGAGKDLVARSIHAVSVRHAHRFVAVNCGAVPDTLFESQLFGHARGAFTGAVQANPGLMVAADKGTLFLDEVGELPLLLQVKLLRALEAKEVWPVGQTRAVPTDCRIIASTNRDVEAEVAAGRLRADLFYRLKVVHITVPPLRERRADIPLLAKHLLYQINGRLGTCVAGVEPDAMHALMNHDWKGNVRELQHALESAIVNGADERITLEALPRDVNPMAAQIPLKEATRQFERARVLEALAQTGFDKREAARLLGLSMASLYRKLDDRSE
ncbi:MAG: sigma-54-dependent Fis family transcriptional regulator [Candidatus Rokubacteria bacterium]|nr:sigma-54-dependent Fis family transcriptional regulator [Candidatus Rokubacteria bacterium]